MYCKLSLSILCTPSESNEAFLHREDLDEDDAADQAKIQALKQYVASFRLSLLHRVSSAVESLEPSNVRN